MGMTIAEKILAKKGGLKQVGPGDLVTVEVDTVILFDNNFMTNRWREILKVKDPDRIIVVFDHRVPAATQASAVAQKIGREFVAKFGIKRFHDVGYSQGISHQLVADHGYGLPGSVLLCSDSHTCSAGVFNCVARGVGQPDIVYAAIKNETWFRVGETVRYEFEGRLPRAVTAKDAFLQIAGQHGDHATQNVEYGGTGIEHLSINARKTLTTMSAELSAEFATFEPDEAMIEWVRARNPAPFEPVYPDRDAKYLAVRKVDLSALEPLVAFPDSVVENSHPVAAAAGIAVDQAFIGSCANGTLDDLQLAASVLAGRRVSSKVRLIVTPGSQTI
jgi:3-isopropylmalate/(R)-2-methylmalate dehydratase large subunit